MSLRAKEALTFYLNCIAAVLIAVLAFEVTLLVLLIEGNG